MSVEIRKAVITDAALLSRVSVEAFLPAHGHSSPKKDIDSYITENFSVENFKKELTNPHYLYHLIYYKNKIAGFSKVIFNTSDEHIVENNVTKMERLYLLKEFYGYQLGTKLLLFNTDIAKKDKQYGIWVEVWIENKRAIKFYKKMGFEIIGNSYFTISENHANPNHIMYLPL